MAIHHTVVTHPVSVRSDDGGDELSDTESAHESVGRALHPRERVRTGNENESLGNDGDLEVNDHVALAASNILDGVDAEGIFEEGCVVDDNPEDNGAEGEVETITDTVGEDFGQIPRVGGRGRQDAVEGECHDGSVVEHGDNQDLGVSGVAGNDLP